MSVEFPQTRTNHLIIERLGLIDYQVCLDHQKEIHAEVVAGSRFDTLLVCTHPPTITSGTSTKPEHILATEEDLVERNLFPIAVGRGGSVTYHGPEQLIAYPILNLKHHKTDVGWYMRSLEEVIIRTLREVSVEGVRMQGKTGVWVREDAKIAFIGVKISKWCTFHGISLNLFRCYENFSLINPCGLGNIQVTSVEEEGARRIPFEEVEPIFIKNFATVFNQEVAC